VMAAAQLGDPDLLASVLSCQRAHLLRELRSLAEADSLTENSHVVSLLITAAELHIRADLQVVDAAETTLRPGVITAQPAWEPVATPGPEAARVQPG
jgi:hypothetical protein